MGWGKGFSGLGFGKRRFSRKLAWERWDRDEGMGTGKDAEERDERGLFPSQLRGDSRRDPGAAGILFPVNP